MKNTLSIIKDGKWFTMTLALAASMFVLVAFAQASSTISTNIQTDGTLTVVSGTSLQGATSTSLAVTGSTTISTTLDVTGALRANGALTVLGLTSLANASTTGEVTIGTIASTSQLIVGGDSTNGTISGAIFGTCNITQVALAATTSAGFACTSATGITTSFKVFVSATSTLVSGAVANAYGGFSIQGASSTASGVIGVQIVNMVGVSATPAGTLNFWAVR